jgi:hypothetical protein
MTDESSDHSAPCDHIFGAWTSERHNLNGVWVALLARVCYLCTAKETSDVGIENAEDEEVEWG